MKSYYDNYSPRAIVGEKTDWKGYFITSHRFYHLPACRQYGHDSYSEFCSETKNIHTFYRKEISVDKKVRRAKLFITADDLYKLYINGDIVGEGPAQSYPHAYNYNCYDITDLLKNGENTIAVHVYYQGLFNIYMVSADNLSGMIAELEIEYQDGEKELIVTDRSWKYTECDAYMGSKILGHQTLFSEDIDMSKLKKGWKENGYNTEDWSDALVTAKPFLPEYNLVPQITPPVSYKKVYPKEIKEIENGYFFDFGKEITGILETQFKGKKGETVEIRFGEELTGNGRARFELRANCVYSDTMTLSGEDDLLEYFDYRGFRYAEIIGKGFDPSEVYAIVRHYPFCEDLAYFKSSSKDLNDIWRICVESVKIGTQDTYYDCPTREKGGFIGDALITGLSHLILTGDTRIYKKYIMDMAYSSRYCPAIMCHVPSYDINILADYSALVPLFLKEYYDYTGDMEFLRETLPTVDGVWEFYSKFLNDDGLLEKIGHMEKVPPEMSPLLVDWPQNFRDGYDIEKAKVGVCTPVNLFFYGMLKEVSELYNIVGDSKKAEEYKELYLKMEKGIQDKLYDNKIKLYKDTEDSDHSAMHTNVLQLFFGLEAPDGYETIKDLIMKRGLNCGVYFAYYVIEGLYRAGYHKEAYKLITNDSIYSWKNMLREGATTCMEVWGAEQKWNTSWCHPWASSPIYFITSRIMGVKLYGLRDNKLFIKPTIEDDIDFMELKIPVPQGSVKVRFERDGERKIYTAEVPETLEVIFEGEGFEFTRK